MPRRMKIPELRLFRRVVEAIPCWRDRMRVKVLYLLAARASEVAFRDSDVPAYGSMMRHRVDEHMGEQILLTKLVTLKKRGREGPVYRIVALPLNPRFEPWARELLDIIEEHGSLEPILNVTRQMLGVSVRRWLKVRPHYLRHARITHLVEYYGFSGVELTVYAGWSFKTSVGVPMMDRYAHLSWRTYLPKLLKPLPRVKTVEM